MQTEEENTGEEPGEPGKDNWGIRPHAGTVSKDAFVWEVCHNCSGADAVNYTRLLWITKTTWRVCEKQQVKQ